MQKFLPLTEAEKEPIRKELKEMIRELRTSSESAKEGTKETVQGGQIADQAAHSFSKGDAAVRHSRHTHRIAELELVLAGLGRFSYGKCTACGGNIPMEMLRAAPGATQCTGCPKR